MQGTQRYSWREFRRRVFEMFFSDAEEQFFAFAAGDERHEWMAKNCSFYVQPGGRAGGHDKRLVEIFYGRRPFEAVREFALDQSGSPALHNRLLVERGACLAYQRTDAGWVFVTVSPAASDGAAPRDEMYILPPLRTVQVLTGPGTLRWHWRLFRALAEVSSLDGDPRFQDRVLVWWLAFTCTRVSEGKSHPPRFETWGLKVLGFALIVGLSGFVLRILDWLAAKPS